MPRRARRALIRLAIAAAALSIAAPVSARNSVSEDASRSSVTPAISVVSPNIIGFESDPSGFPPEPFTGRDNPTVHFRDTQGNDLSTGDFAFQSNGGSIAAMPDADRSAIDMRFDIPTTRISLLFGKDDSNHSQEGDTATLRVYRLGEVVATEHVVMNRNDIADQTIVYEGVPVTRAIFVYEREGEPIRLIEIADDITLDQICTIPGGGAANVLPGTARHDGICGKGGDDRLLGRAGNDRLDGGSGHDRLNGGSGDDLAVGGTGDDTIRLVDGISGNDTAYGGPGDDTCTIDARDTVYRCETVIVD